RFRTGSHSLLIYEIMETFSIRITNYKMHDRIDFDKIIEINSGSEVIYKSECKCCKITKALKRLRDGTQNQISTAR
ncbi:22853_t:CDS:1, partial [Dentiscutata erythropus]